MTKSFRAATIAACCISLAGLAASGSAFGSSEILDSDSGSLLPQSVISTAAQEGETPVNYTIIPEVPLDSDDVTSGDADRATSLAALVADHSATTTRDREEECLAGAVYFESKAEHLEGQLAVAKVIVNRAASGRFPRSLCGVVFQRGQFSFVRGGGFPPIARGGQDWREAVAIARIAREDLWKSPVPKALFFHARHVSPGWRLTRIASVGNHVFYH